MALPVRRGSSASAPRSGCAVGRLAVRALRRVRLAVGGLYPVASLAVAALAFGARGRRCTARASSRSTSPGSRSAARTMPAKRTIITFHEGLAWLAQVGDVPGRWGCSCSRRELGEVALEGTVLGARDRARRAAGRERLSRRAVPGFSVRERSVLGWAGLRGAVPVVLATFPVIEGVPGSVEFFNIVFFAVVVSTRAPGRDVRAARARARRDDHEPALPRPLAEPARSARLGAEVVEYPVEPERRDRRRARARARPAARRARST